MENCPCGREHTFDIEGLEVAKGNLTRVAEILDEYNFPKKILMVADNNSFRVTSGLTETLIKGGYTLQMRVYDDVKVATMEMVEEIKALCSGVDGVLSVGTGSVNDVCRLGSFMADKQFAIFATAPSMDGFASDSAPIIKDGFKYSYPCRQPRLVMADSTVLAQSPNELKAAGFGDMVAKYIAVADWRVAQLVCGDYLCDKVCELVREGVGRIIALCDKITQQSEDAVEAIMEALVLSGITMQLAKCTRPASGTEHIISHYWECKKLEKGVISDYHGKKVGVATLIVADVYHKVANMKNVVCKKENLDWQDIYDTYGEVMAVDVKKLNNPTITDLVDPDFVTANWDKICSIIKEEIPPVETLKKYYEIVGAVTTGEEIAVDKELFDEGLTYHPYMRYRMTLARLMPMLGLNFTEIYYSDKK